MKLTSTNRYIITLALVTSALLAGCSTTKTLYGWNDYQPEVYGYFQGSDIDNQIIALENNLDEFKAKGKRVPPGFHAHLGMLYAQVGNMDRAAQEFTTEKKIFPESALYMDFLLNKKDFSKTASAKSKNEETKHVAIQVNDNNKKAIAIEQPTGANSTTKKE